MIAIPLLAYHDYEGVAVNLEERERIVADLGDRRLMMLRNHGTLSVGRSAADCWVGMFFLERACRQQVIGPSGGTRWRIAGAQAAQDEVSGLAERSVDGALPWPGCLRQLERKSPGYDN